jgi:hypothetical protein
MALPAVDFVGPLSPFVRHHVCADGRALNRMAKGSKFTQDVQAILRKKGMLDPHARGATLENIMAANQRRRVEGKDPRGGNRKLRTPRSSAIRSSSATWARIIRPTSSFVLAWTPT